MKISTLNIPASVADDYNLQPVKMSKLGKVVVIAGRNGAGKTRFLRLLKTTYENHPGNEVKEYKQKKAALEQRNATLNLRINNRLRPQRPLDSLNLQTIKRNLTEINRLEAMILNSTYGVIEPDQQKQGMIAFFPKGTSLLDTYTMSQQQIEQNERHVDNLGTDHIEQGVVAKIQRITQHYISAVSPDKKSKMSEETTKKYIADFKNLSATIEQFLNVPLEYDDDLHPTLFGKRIGMANLSQGQAILLQLCLAIYAQGHRLNNHILLIDEPENHLYPKALLEALDKIIANISDGQVWITTHSVHVLAHFDPSTIWYIEEGNIRYAGNIPNTVLSGLIGGEQEKRRLANFLSLPEIMAFTQFSYECLMDPKVLFTGFKDPQVNQTHELLQEMMQAGKRLKVMDFGMGQGRLLATIDELEKQAGRNVTNWLDYYGYDISDEYKCGCEALFNNIYADGQARYFNDQGKAMAKLDKGDFDLIVMCNVLHEIDPKDWITLFTASNTIYSLLKPTGHLVLIEDQLLPVGEMAHANGFLVLDAPQFKSLFKVKSTDGYYCKIHAKNDRLKAHCIPSPFITQIDDKSRREAILSVKDEALAQIKKIRQSKDTSFQAGRLLAFWTQQLANATLIINELGYISQSEQTPIFAIP